MKSSSSSSSSSLSPFSGHHIRPFMNNTSISINDDDDDDVRRIYLSTSIPSPSSFFFNSPSVASDDFVRGRRCQQCYDGMIVCNGFMPCFSCIVKQRECTTHDTSSSSSSTTTSSLLLLLSVASPPSQSSM